MVSVRVVAIAVAVVFVLAFAGGAVAGPPTDQLKGAVDHVLKVLEDPSLKGESRTAERRAAVQKIAQEIFDFQETGKRSLGRHWQSRTPAERTEFTQLFADLLEHAYISKIDQYSGENVKYVGESIEGDQATVRTKVLDKDNRELQVDYRMLRSSDRWLIYDVLVEGVSLVANYRAQFDQIIRTSSYQQLVEKLKSSSSS